MQDAIFVFQKRLGLYGFRAFYLELAGHGIFTQHDIAMVFSWIPARHVPDNVQSHGIHAWFQTPDNNG